VALKGWGRCALGTSIRKKKRKKGKDSREKRKAPGTGERAAAMDVIKKGGVQVLSSEKGGDRAIRKTLGTRGSGGTKGKKSQNVCPGIGPGPKTWARTKGAKKTREPSVEKKRADHRRKTKGADSAGTRPGG